MFYTLLTWKTTSITVHQRQTPNEVFCFLFFFSYWYIFLICSGWHMLVLWFITNNKKTNRGHSALVSQLKREASLLSMQTVANLSVMTEAYAAIRVIFCHIYCSRWLWVVPMVCMVTDPRQWPTHLDHYGFLYRRKIWIPIAESLMWADRRKPGSTICLHVSVQCKFLRIHPFQGNKLWITCL